MATISIKESFPELHKLGVIRGISGKLNPNKITYLIENTLKDIDRVREELKSLALNK